MAVKYFVSYFFTPVDGDETMAKGMERDVIMLEEKPETLNDIHTMENIIYSRIESEGKIRLVNYILMGEVTED
jgi:hypothetical protein